MQEIERKFGGREIMPSLAERLVERGKTEGKLEGEREGEKGAIKGKQTVLIKQFRLKFGLPPSDKQKIRSVTDESKLDAAVETILNAKSKNGVLKLFEP